MSGGFNAAEQGYSTVEYRPGLNADLASADGLAGGPVALLPFEGTPHDHKFCLGLAGQGLRCMGVLVNAVEYGRDTSKIQKKGRVYARVKAAATALPGAYLAPEWGSTHHFYVSAAPTPFRLITDLSGQTVGTIYGPEQPTSGGAIPQILIGEGPISNTVYWHSPDTLDRDGVCASQTPGGAGDLTIAGALATAGVATFDCVRCVGVYGSGNETGKNFTIYGTNILGESISETIAGPNNTTVFTALAFKTVTRVAVDAGTAAAVEVGTGDKLGLPDAAAVRLVEATIFNGVVEGTAATLAKDADEIEKNTLDPNSALNGSQVLALLYER